MKDIDNITNLVMDVMLEHEYDLSDGYFYYLPIDEIEDNSEMEPEDAQKMALWRICKKIVDTVLQGTPV